MSFDPKSLLASNLFVRWLPLIAFCAVIAHYFWFVNSNAINIPFHDDIYDFLQFVNLVEAADSTEAVIREWLRQYNDHRTSASRLQVYAAYLVEGEVNFHTHTLMANLALPLILFLFYLGVRGEENRWIYLLVSALLLLNLRAYSVVLWGQPAFAYYYVYFYAFAGLFALHKVTVPKFVLAAVLCSLSAFTFAAGQIVWVLGLVSLLHQSLVTGRRSLLYPAMWLLVAVAMLLVWRAGFTPSDWGGAVDNSERVRAIFPGMLIDPSPLQVLARYLPFILVVLGSAVTDSSTLVAGAASFIMLAVLSFISIRFYKSEDIRLALCCWYAVASVVALAVGRAMIGTPDFFLRTNNRYSFLSVMLMCTLALLVQVRFRVFKTPAVYLLVLLAGIYSVWTYRHFDTPLQDLMTRRYTQFNDDRYPVFGKRRGPTMKIVRHAISEGTYKPPCRPMPQCKASPTAGE